MVFTVSLTELFYAALFVVWAVLVLLLYILARRADKKKKQRKERGKDEKHGV